MRRLVWITVLAIVLAAPAAGFALGGDNDGTFSVIPPIPGGVTTSQQLRTIADVADRYQVRMIKLTGGQRIDLLGVSKADLPAVWRDLGMPSGP